MEEKRKFPTFAVIVLIFALYWFLKEMRIITFTLPYIPLLLIILVCGWIINHHFRS